jgi:hypothetical protein
MCFLLMFNSFNYSSITSIAQCNGPFNHFNSVACLARYIAYRSIACPNDDRVGRSELQHPRIGDRDRSSTESIMLALRSDREVGAWGRLSSRSGSRRPQEVVSGVPSDHVSGHRADRAVSLSRPDTFRDRIDFGSKPDSIRSKTNPAL